MAPDMERIVETTSLTPFELMPQVSFAPEMTNSSLLVTVLLVIVSLSSVLFSFTQGKQPLSRPSEELPCSQPTMEQSSRLARPTVFAPHRLVPNSTSFFSQRVLTVLLCVIMMCSLIIIVSDATKVAVVEWHPSMRAGPHFEKNDPSLLVERTRSSLLVDLASGSVVESDEWTYESGSWGCYDSPESAVLCGCKGKNACVRETVGARATAGRHRPRLYSFSHHSVPHYLSQRGVNTSLRTAVLRDVRALYSGMMPSMFNAFPSGEVSTACLPPVRREGLKLARDAFRPCVPACQVQRFRPVQDLQRSRMCLAFGLYACFTPYFAHNTWYMRSEFPLSGEAECCPAAPLYGAFLQSMNSDKGEFSQSGSLYSAFSHSMASPSLGASLSTVAIGWARTPVYTLWMFLWGALSMVYTMLYQPLAIVLRLASLMLFYGACVIPFLTCHLAIRAGSTGAAPVQVRGAARGTRLSKRPFSSKLLWFVLLALCCLLQMPHQAYAAGSDDPASNAEGDALPGQSLDLTAVIPAAVGVDAHGDNGGSLPPVTGLSEVDNTTVVAGTTAVGAGSSTVSHPSLSGDGPEPAQAVASAMTDGAQPQAIPATVVNPEVDATVSINSGSSSSHGTGISVSTAPAASVSVGGASATTIPASAAHAAPLPSVFVEVFAPDVLPTLEARLGPLSDIVTGSTTFNRAMITLHARLSSIVAAHRTVAQDGVTAVIDPESHGAFVDAVVGELVRFALVAPNFSGVDDDSLFALMHLIRHWVEEALHSPLLAVTRFMDQPSRVDSLEELASVLGLDLPASLARQVSRASTVRLDGATMYPVGPPGSVSASPLNPAYLALHNQAMASAAAAAAQHDLDGRSALSLSTQARENAYLGDFAKERKSVSSADSAFKSMVARNPFLKNKVSDDVGRPAHARAWIIHAANAVLLPKDIASYADPSWTANARHTNSRLVSGFWDTLGELDRNRIARYLLSHQQHIMETFRGSSDLDGASHLTVPRLVRAITEGQEVAHFTSLLYAFVHGDAPARSLLEPLVRQDFKSFGTVSMSSGNFASRFSESAELWGTLQGDSWHILHLLAQLSSDYRDKVYQRLDQLADYDGMTFSSRDVSSTSRVGRSATDDDVIDHVEAHRRLLSGRSSVDVVKRFFSSREEFLSIVTFVKEHARHDKSSKDTGGGGASAPGTKGDKGSKGKKDTKPGSQFCQDCTRKGMKGDLAWKRGHHLVDCPSRTPVQRMRAASKLPPEIRRKVVEANRQRQDDPNVPQIGMLAVDRWGDLAASVDCATAFVCASEVDLPEASSDTAAGAASTTRTYTPVRSGKLSEVKPRIGTRLTAPVALTVVDDAVADEDPELSTFVCAFNKDTVITANALVDSGADSTVLSSAFCDKFNISYSRWKGKVRLADGRLVTPYVTDNVLFASRRYDPRVAGDQHPRDSCPIRPFVLDHGMEQDLILGTDLLSELGFGILASGCPLTSGNDMFIPADLPVSPAEPPLRHVQPSEHEPHPDAALRERVQRAVQPLLDANAAIPANATCDHELATVRLKLTEKARENLRSRKGRMPKGVKGEALAKQMRAWIAEGVYEPRKYFHNSAAGLNRPYVQSNMVVVPKRDGVTGQWTKWRVCLDATGINKYLIDSDEYPIPSVSDVLSSVPDDTEVISVLDLRSAFNILTIAEESRGLLGVHFNGTDYQARKLPFGLVCGSSSLSRLLHDIFKDLIPKGLVIYLDDISICTNERDHIPLLTEVIRRLNHYNITITAEKSAFALKTARVLGHTIGPKGAISLDTAKLADIPVPPLDKNVTAHSIRSYLGFVRYFSEQVPAMAELTSVLNPLSHKPGSFRLSEEQAQAVSTINEVLLNALTIEQPLPDRDIIVQCDASFSGIAGVVFQTDPVTNKPRYLGVYSKALTPAQSRWSANRVETLAVTECLVRFEHLLLGKKFYVLSDHSALQYILHSKKLQPTVVNHFETLARFAFDVIYQPGNSREHLLVDSLSRLYDDRQLRPRPLKGAKGNVPPMDLPAENPTPVVPQVAAVRSSTAATRGNSSVDLKSNVTDPDAALARALADWDALLISDLDAPASSSDLLDPVQGLRDLSDRRYADQRRALVRNQHEKSHGSADQMVLALMRQGYTWKNIRSQCKDIWEACVSCQRYRPGPYKGYFPHVPRAPLYPFDLVSMDVAEMNVESSGYAMVLVVTDLCTRYMVLKPLRTQQAREVAHVVLDIMVNYGPWRAVRTDAYSSFKSKLMQEVFDILGTSHTLSVPYIKEMNAVSERSVGLFKTLLNKMMDAAGSPPNEWFSHLHTVQLALNLRVSSVHGSRPWDLVHPTPFRSPPSPDDDGLLVTDPSDLQSRLRSIDWDELERLLPAARNDLRLRLQFLRYEVFPDLKLTAKHKARRIKELRDSNFVYLKDTTRPTKMAPVWLGPYQMVRVDDKGMCILANRVTPGAPIRTLDGVYHINLLRPMKEVDTSEESDLWEFEKIIAHRGGSHLNKPYHLQILWKNGEITWEPLKSFRNEGNAKTITNYFKSKGIILSKIDKLKLKPNKKKLSASAKKDQGLGSERNAGHGGRVDSVSLDVDRVGQEDGVRPSVSVTRRVTRSQARKGKLSDRSSSSARAAHVAALTGSPVLTEAVPSQDLDGFTNNHTLPAPDDSAFSARVSPPSLSPDETGPGHGDQE
eukprot:TRINITY_DN0_c0_g1_i9.p1 TRINITY_DN0_c0_g1~~TRINITY_DN0_c0_g1_i9.p1  ORF type:complete len:2666 (-),score=288.07 TRINITY_DN0_c0_g1_i9:1336-9333(-)